MLVTWIPEVPAFPPSAEPLERSGHLGARVSQPACWRSAGKKKDLKIFDFELDITGASSGHAWGMGLSGSRRARAFLGRAAAASS